jgi:hypothetical protein
MKKAYSEMSARSRRRHRAALAATLSSTNDRKASRKELAELSIDTIQEKGNLSPTLKLLFESEKTAKVIEQVVVKPELKKTKKQQLNRTRRVFNRKLSYIGRKKQKKHQKYEKCSKLKLGKVEVPQVEYSEHSDNDKKAFEYMRSCFPGTLPEAKKIDSISFDHAFVDAEEMLRAAIVFIFTTESLHESFHWFWDNANNKPKMNHFEVSTFFDGFPIFGGSNNCTQFTFRLLNLASYAQQPMLSFPLFIAKCKETNAGCIKLLRKCGDDLAAVLNKSEGIEISFTGFDDSKTLPKSTIPLNGVHRVTFGKNIFGGDAKAVLFSQGCKSASQSFLPFFTLRNEDLVHPDFPIQTKNVLPLKTRIQKFLAVQKFREAQKEVFLTEVGQLKKTKLTQKEIAKKTCNAWERLLVTAVSQEAARLETGCVHFKPFEIAEECTVCSLHIDTNEYLRVLRKIVTVCASVTVEQKLAPTWEKIIGSSCSSNACIPNILCAHSESPLKRAMEVLQKAGLARIVEYFISYYSPPVQTLQSSGEELNSESDVFELLDIDEDSEMSSAALQKRTCRIRLLGIQVKQASPFLAELVDCLHPANSVWPDGNQETVEQKRTRIVCWTYVHLLLCLSGIFNTSLQRVNVDNVGAMFIGELFVRLVHRFALHKSCNTFLFAQAAPYLMNTFQTKLQLTPNLALGMGISSRSEGGELGNKMCKQQINTWISRRQNCFLQLMHQRISIFVGGLHLFPDALPASEDLLEFADENEIDMHISNSHRQRFPNSQTEICDCCRTHKHQHTMHAVLGLGQVDELRTHSFEGIEKRAQQTSFKGLSLSFLFEKFVHVRIAADTLICEQCAYMAQLSMALFFGDQDKLCWV